ncbi:MAG: hypothetical protein WBP43_12005 [Chitinophagales bacterium]
MRIWHYCLLILLVAIEGYFIVRYTASTLENNNWTGPYFSAAANLRAGGDFMIDEEEVIKFKTLPIFDQYKYHFNKSSNLEHYNHNPVGFAYIIRFATFVFPFAGDINALILLQVITHLLLCFLLLNTIKTKQFRILFILLYVINPIIIKFVVLDYYYFWQCIPGFLIVYLLNATVKNVKLVYLLGIILIFATLSRITILFISLLTLGLLFKYIPIKHAVALTTLFAIGFITINKPTEKNIWHTIYVGIAAYPNQHVKTLSDEEGYALYEKVTGVELEARIGYNYYDPEVINAYQTITKDAVVEIANENPWLFIRNAILNSFQSFSPGYVTLNIVWLNMLLAFTGFIFLILLITSKQYLILISIALYAGSFCLYYPPIQAYLFGAYVLLVAGLYNILIHYKLFAPKTQVKQVN